ncbi:aconitate hydratase [Vallitalea guaymasensis]|uniref:Aconitate hydratase n=1 Tax=Vallitalea guaymasensis TaxID=1185412 RepID=A0A8J8M796_9FIRM|nr:aconitate hydratase [Vallitalea guaymasensis]QUH27470.1 aconitate hydratase [Vallitalea guaymasensis]
MGLNLTQKIIKDHLLEGEMIPGSEIGIKIDQTLTQDSTGTMAYLQLEAMEIDKVKTKRSVAYIDHNMLQQGFENADDHKYIQTVAHKHGVYFSRPGNGICHQVHLERFGVPGETLLGSDSHTPTGGGIGMLAIGAGGLDVAVAMGGGTYYITMPKVVNVKLTGKLKPFVTAKDIILEVLRVMTVKGGVGKVIEYTGEGVSTLSVPERATITNMGAELGATTSVFQSDDVTLSFLKAQDREELWKELKADEDAAYDETININLDELEPLVAMPHSPDNVEKISNIKDLKVNQVCIGSCTNSSYLDMMKVSKILKGKTVHPDVSLVIAPGSKQVLNMLAANGALADMIAAGARILESGCGPCIGMGQAPATDAVTLRTFNRNFKGRCGTVSAGAYLLSPEAAAVSALSGELTDPTTCTTDINVAMPDKFYINDNMVVPPAEDGSKVEVVKGPNIKPFPLNEELKDDVEGKVLIIVEDNITTDHIMPSNAKLLPFRSNIPHLANYCLTPCDEEFPKRAKANGGGMIVGGDNYGQGSSREHAALVPLYLGIKAVLAKSFARIHKANLINSGILPLTFINMADYDTISLDDDLSMDNVLESVKTGKVIVHNKTKKLDYEMNIELSDKELKMIIAGGKINFIKNM